MKRVAVTGIAMIGLALCHYGWFALFGPPAGWGSGTEVLVPAFAGRTPRDFTPYLNEAALRREAAASDSMAPDVSGDVAGAVFHRDSAPVCGLSVIQTHGGRFWSEEQHLYVRAASGADWRELALPRPMIVEDATVVCPDDRPLIFLARWNSWWPYKSSYGRYLLSTVVPELRPQYAVYALDVERVDLEYLFPGRILKASPDHRWVAYLTSRNGFSGFHNIMVYDTRTGSSTRVLSLEEVDPGSGESFTYDWSSDSEALVVSGSASGFTPSPERMIPVRMVYIVGTGKLFDLDAPEASRRPDPSDGAVRDVASAEIP